jgi:hypothetical protein
MLAQICYNNRQKVAVIPKYPATQSNLLRRLDMSILPLSEDIIQKFWGKVDVNGENECWEWQAGCIPDGYGQFWIHGKNKGSHRVAWTITYGNIGEWQVLHHCDNPPCCNPLHLFLGTNADNIKDRDRKGRGVLPDNSGERHGLSKLKEKQVLEIRDLAGKLPVKQIAEIYGISQSCASMVINRQRWRHI